SRRTPATPTTSLSGASSGGFRRLRIAKRARSRQQLAGLQQRLQAGEDHRPAAVELAVSILAQLVVGDREPARILDLLDLPGDARGPLTLHVLAPEGVEALHQPVGDRKSTRL